MRTHSFRYNGYRRPLLSGARVESEETVVVSPSDPTERRRTIPTSHLGSGLGRILPSSTKDPEPVDEKGLGNHVFSFEADSSTKDRTTVKVQRPKRSRGRPSTLRLSFVSLTCRHNEGSRVSDVQWTEEERRKEDRHYVIHVRRRT